MQRCFLSFLSIALIGCSLMPPRRQYIAELKAQTVPTEILNTSWEMQSYDHHAPDCSIKINFRPKGQFVFHFKNEEYADDAFWYLMKSNDTIDFHLHPLEKIAWTSDNCQMNPSHFALAMEGSWKLKITSDQLMLVDRSNVEMIFKKIL